MIHKQKQTIKTNIKFYTDLDNEKGRLYGFITKSNGSWRGCRDTEEKKKIVFVDAAIKESIIPNALYNCSLVPMNNEKGFIAMSATLIQFKASVITNYREDKNIFQVIVKFGNKRILFDPSSKKNRERNISKIADNLRNRSDLLNGHAVAEDFINNACIVQRLYKQHLNNVSK